jgi:sulfotransferase
MKEMIKQIIREELNRELSKRYYFMSGLPRSGSTLLSSLLNQNPNFYSGPSSPVVPTMIALENSLSNDELFMAYPKPEQAHKIISSVMDNYYSDVTKPVIFDKNRSWVNRLHYIPGYFGFEPKVLCPVRNIDEILTSFITMHRRNPYIGNGKINFMDEMLIKTNTPLNDENRCRLLGNEEYGILGQSYAGIRQAIMQGYRKNLHFIEYDDLMNNPEETMRKIYEFLGEPYFEHDFSNIENVHKEKDAEVYGLADMHDVRKELSKTSPDPKEILPQVVCDACVGMEYWRNLDEQVDFDQINKEEETQSKQTDSEPLTTEEDDTKIIGA